MRKTLFVLWITVPLFCLHAVEITKDSVLTRVEEIPKRGSKLETLVDSMDYARGPERLLWAKKLYEASSKAKHEYFKEESLTEMLRHYVNTDVRDSARFYLAEAERTLHDGDYKSHLITFMKTIMDVRIVCHQKSAEGDSLITQALLRLKNSQNETALQRTADNYLLGMAAGVHADTDYEGKGKDVVYYFTQVLKETEELPTRVGMFFRPNSFYLLCGLLTEGKERVIHARRYLDLLTQNEADLQRKNRNTMGTRRHWLNAYGMLATSSEVLSKEEANLYFEQFAELNKRYPEDANLTPAYEYYYTAVNYYKGLHAYRNALEACDSMIVVLKRIGYEEHSIQYLKEKVDLCDSLHLYKEGFEAFRAYDALQKRLLEINKAAETKELYIERKVDQLIIANKTLEVDNRRILNYLLLALCLLAIGSVLYVIFYLRRSKEMNRKLQEANAKLIEVNDKLVETGGQLKSSEKMRYAFIHNMCNEIYAPLNAIKGFSDILIDDNLGAEERKAFLAIISDNSSEVNKKLDDIQEIVRLGSSSELLPVDLANLHTLCARELEQLKLESGKTEIDYTVEGDFEHDMVSINQTYFRYVLGHLLTDLNQNMNEGSLIISYELNAQSQKALVYITANHKQADTEATASDEIGSAEITFFVCRMIAERMNARLWVDGEFEGGTRFVFELLYIK